MSTATDEMFNSILSTNVLASKRCVYKIYNKKSIERETTASSEQEV